MTENVAPLTAADGFALLVFHHNRHCLQQREEFRRRFNGDGFPQHPPAGTNVRGDEIEHVRGITLFQHKIGQIDERQKMRNVTQRIQRCRGLINIVVLDHCNQIRSEARSCAEVRRHHCAVGQEHFLEQKTAQRSVHVRTGASAEARVPGFESGLGSLRPTDLRGELSLRTVGFDNAIQVFDWFNRHLRHISGDNGVDLLIFRAIGLNICCCKKNDNGADPVTFHSSLHGLAHLRFRSKASDLVN